MSGDTRPETMAAFLRDVADYLDGVDENVGKWATTLGSDWKPGSEVQADLLALAAFLDTRPDLDASLHAALPALPAAEDPR